MQPLATDFSNILEKNQLPQVNVKHGETMMGIISSFQRHYMDKSKRTQQKRKLRDELTFSSSSDEGISKKKTKEAE